MRHFSARETEWLQELDGIELAGFWPRAFAFLFDWMLVLMAFTLVIAVATGSYVGVQRMRGKPLPAEVHFGADKRQPADQKEGAILAEKALPMGVKVRAQKLETGEIVDDVLKLVVPVLYFGILLWTGKGRTPGKRLMRIRVVSLVHRHITFWHAVERALGYGAAALELGFGFLQFFLHPYRRCAQDRLAETIVVTERGYQAMRYKFEREGIAGEEATGAA